MMRLGRKDWRLSMRERIWKLQRPLFSSDGNLEVMAYTEEREQVVIISLPQEVVDEVFGDELKIYARGKIKNGNLAVREVVPEQDW